MKDKEHIFLFLFIFLVIRCECLPTRGNKKHKSSSHAGDIAKKQQVLVPLRNFAASSFGQNNALMSPLFHLEGTNEVSPLKDPTTVFLNGENQADPYQAPMENQQSEDNEGPLQEAPLGDNNFRVDSSLFSDRMENYRDGGGGNENNDDSNAAYEDNNQQTLDHTNNQYLNQTPEEEDTEPPRTVMDYNDYDSSYNSNAVQGLPTLSTLVASRLRAANTLNLLGLKHSALGMPYYSSLVKNVLKNKARGEKTSLKSDPEMTSEGAKNDSPTQSHSKTHVTDEEERKSEDAKKLEQEYKQKVQTAELAANLAEAAKTLTRLVKKLTEHDAMINRKQEEERAAKKNNSQDVSGGWSEWSKWSRCSATCGGGLTYTTRNCPAHGGQHCSGRRIRVRMCNLNRCKNAHDKKVNLERSLGEMAAARSHISRT